MKTKREKALEALDIYLEKASGHSCKQCPAPSDDDLTKAIRAVAYLRVALQQSPDEVVVKRGEVENGKMPEEIWACNHKHDGNHWVDSYPVWGGSTKYTRSDLTAQPAEEMAAAYHATNAPEIMSETEIALLLFPDVDSECCQLARLDMLTRIREYCPDGIKITETSMQQWEKMIDRDPAAFKRIMLDGVKELGFENFDEFIAECLRKHKEQK